MNTLFHRYIKDTRPPYKRKNIIVTGVTLLIVLAIALPISILLLQPGRVVVSSGLALH